MQFKKRSKLSYLKIGIFTLLPLSICYLILIRSSHLTLISSTSRYKIADNPNFEYKGNDTYLVSPRIKCSCQTNELIRINRPYAGSNHYQVSLVNETEKTPIVTRLFNLSQFEFENWNTTCDLYSVFRRGNNQKVVAFSLFGRDEFYYNNLKKLTRQVRELYPGWILRIYYDSTVDQSVICDLQCEHESIVEFCDAERLQFRINEPNDLYNASLMHKMMWRFLPLGETFVSSLMFRDSDSLILQV
jgi:hypothetical protein